MIIINSLGKIMINLELIFLKIEYKIIENSVEMYFFCKYRLVYKQK